MKTKRVLSFVLCMMMLLTVLPAQLISASGTKNGDGATAFYGPAYSLTVDLETVGEGDGEFEYVLELLSPKVTVSTTFSSSYDYQCIYRHFTNPESSSYYGAAAETRAFDRIYNANLAGVEENFDEVMNNGAFIDDVSNWRQVFNERFNSGPYGGNCKFYVFS